MPATTPAALAMAMAITTALSAQTPGCDPAWQVASTFAGFEGAGAATMWDPDGPGPMPEQIVVAGIPSFAGVPAMAYDLEHNGIAMYDPIGETWSPFPVPLPTPTAPNQGVVDAMVRDPFGRLVISRDDVLYRLQSGAWVQLGTFSGPVRQILPLPNTEILVGGNFTSVDGIAARGIARFDSATWQEFAGGVLGQVRTMRTLPNGDLLVSGQFSAAGGVATASLARWDGAQWNAYPTPPNVPAVVTPHYNAMDVLPNGDVVTTSGTFNGGVLRWDGQQWGYVGGATSESILTLAVDGNGDLLVAGQHLTSIDGVPVRFVARWDGAQWLPVGSGLDRAGISKFVRLPNGELVARGGFTTAGGKATRGLARWDGDEWQTFGDGFNHGVLCLERLANADLACGGLFLGLATATTRADGIARFDGTSWWPYGAGLDGAVREIVEMPNGDLVAVGHFFGSGSTPMRGVARWDGTTWQALGATGTDGPVLDAALMPNGDLIIGGFFTQVDGVAASCVARWDGAQWSALGAGLANTAETLVVDANGDLVAGGLFTSAGGTAANGVAAWRQGAWQPLGAGVGATRAMTLDAEGRLVAFGSPFVQRWDGAAWTVLGDNTYPYATNVAVMPNGDLIAAHAGNADPSAYYTLGMVTRWPANAGAGPVVEAPDGPVYDVLREPDGSLLVCGQFETIGAGAGGAPTRSPFLARIATPCPATATVHGAGCTGAAGPVALTSVEPAWLGATCRARCTGLPTASIALQALSFQTASIPLPMATSPSCALWLQQPVADVVAHTNGVADATLAIPTTTALVGQTFYQQVVSVELSPNGAVTGLASSNGLEQTIGAF